MPDRRVNAWHGYGVTTPHQDGANAILMVSTPSQWNRHHLNGASMVSIHRDGIDIIEMVAIPPRWHGKRLDGIDAILIASTPSQWHPCHPCGIDTTEVRWCQYYHLGGIHRQPSPFPSPLRPRITGRRLCCGLGNWRCLRGITRALIRRWSRTRDKTLWSRVALAAAMVIGLVYLWNSH